MVGSLPEIDSSTDSDPETANTTRFLEATEDSSVESESVHVLPALPRVHYTSDPELTSSDEDCAGNETDTNEFEEFIEELS